MIDIDISYYKKSKISIVKVDESIYIYIYIIKKRWMNHIRREKKTCLKCHLSL